MSFNQRSFEDTKLKQSECSKVADNEPVITVLSSLALCKQSKIVEINEKPDPLIHSCHRWIIDEISGLPLSLTGINKPEQIHTDAWAIPITGNGDYDTQCRCNVLDSINKSFGLFIMDKTPGPCFYRAKEENGLRKFKEESPIYSLKTMAVQVIVDTLMKKHRKDYITVSHNYVCQKKMFIISKDSSDRLKAEYDSIPQNLMPGDAHFAPNILHKKVKTVHDIVPLSDNSRVSTDNGKKNSEKSKEICVTSLFPIDCRFLLDIDDISDPTEGRNGISRRGIHQSYCDNLSHSTPYRGSLLSIPSNEIKALVYESKNAYAHMYGANDLVLVISMFQQEMKQMKIPNLLVGIIVNALIINFIFINKVIPSAIQRSVGSIICSKIFEDTVFKGKNTCLHKINLFLIEKLFRRPCNLNPFLRLANPCFILVRTKDKKVYMNNLHSLITHLQCIYLKKYDDSEYLQRISKQYEELFEIQASDDFYSEYMQAEFQEKLNMFMLIIHALPPRKHLEYSKEKQRIIRKTLEHNKSEAGEASKYNPHFDMDNNYNDEILYIHLANQKEYEKDMPPFDAGLMFKIAMVHELPHQSSFQYSKIHLLLKSYSK